jgi:tetratricopeptide (TPR) repeat protein
MTTRLQWEGEMRRERRRTRLPAAMPRTGGIAALLLAALLWCPLAEAQNNAATLQDLWMEAASQAVASDFEGANERIDRFRQVSQQIGLERHPLFARSAAGLARQAQIEGNRELRQWAIGAALRLDSGLPEVHFTLAELARADRDWRGVIQSLVSGVRSVYAKYTAAVVANGDLLITFAVAFLVFAAAAGVVLTLRYGRQIIHDLREWLSTRLSPGASTVVAFAFLLLPIFLWLHPLWLVPYWLALAFGYAALRERILVVVVLVGLALLPLLVAWSSYRIAGSRAPVIQATEVVHREAYDPEVAARLSELLQVMPEDPRVHLLSGNLSVLEGNERQAMLHYQRAAELNDRFAGAHLNIGNIHFLNGDLPAATVRYERAAALDPTMVAAYFNAAVVAGESFNFERQAQQLDQAKRVSRSATQKLLANPPRRKVHIHRMSYNEAWNLAEASARLPAARELFGNYARFNQRAALVHPLTIGSLLALLGAVLIWFRRRKTGFAGVCVKCGRTFCLRCKSSRESATYCTQCIHIYIKRDGVLNEAKQRKMSEVQQYHRGRLRQRKTLTIFLPGSGSILEGATWRGAFLLLAFAIFLSIAFFTGRLAPIASPAETMQLALRILAGAGALLVWLLALIPTLRAKVTVV